MEILLHIVIGLVMIVVGVLTLMKNYQVTNSLPLSFFEQHLGPGSSYMIWKLISILLVFAGFTVMFGFYDELLRWALSPLTRLLSGSNGDTEAL